MAVYFIANIDVNDAAVYGEYGKLFYGVFDKYKGKVLAVDREYEVLEGKWSADHTVILEFPTKADLKAWYESAEYQELVALRTTASDADIVVIQGR
jgi:uncharacterized protein (DUF1330 family)